MFYQLDDQTAESKRLTGDKDRQDMLVVICLKSVLLLSI